MEHKYISSIIVVKNEENLIKKSLLSLINQDYPKNMYEIILVDSMSEDNTLSIAQDLLEKSQCSYQMLKNEKGILAAGWNMGIKASKGDFVVRIDAHSEVDSDFLTKSMETMLDIKDAVCVGGRAETVSHNEQGRIISMVLSSPFGVGNSHFRTSSKAQYSDTAAHGLYKKAIFDKVGYFDESLLRNQDNDMHSRIKKVGGKFYFNPEIKCKYFPRDQYTKLLKQGYQNGRWNIIVLKKDKEAMSIRHLIPLLFLLSLLIFIPLAFLYKYFLYLIITEISIYLICALIAALEKSKKIFDVLRIILLFLCYHICYGLGSLVSILKGGNL